MAAHEPIIIKDPDILGGTPVFRGTRVPFQALLDYLEGGQPLDEFLDDFPTVTREAAIEALELAKSALSLAKVMAKTGMRIEDAIAKVTCMDPFDQVKDLGRQLTAGLGRADR